MNEIHLAIKLEEQTLEGENAMLREASDSIINERWKDVQAMVNAQESLVTTGAN